MIEVECPHCHEILEMAPAYAGQRTTCMQCGGIIRVPIEQMRPVEKVSPDGTLPPVPQQILEKRRQARRRRNLVVGLVLLLVLAAVALAYVFVTSSSEEAPTPGTIPAAE